MTSEEIHLNQALEHAGIEAVETDLGEYIIQLAGHRPSHIVAPAMHLSAEQIAEILSKPAGERLPSSAKSSPASPGRPCGRSSPQADVGITGANFAIAETGSIVLVSNEGNGRLTCALPKCHIAIMGMEKVIPRLADLPVFPESAGPRRRRGRSCRSIRRSSPARGSRARLDGPESSTW